MLYYIFLAHIFSLLVQYQEFASTRNSDFYRFLYNRSKIKPITQHFNKNIHTKISTAKEVFRKSKCVNNGEKRLFHLDVKKHPQIEEEKIQDWLTNVDEDGIDKKKTEILKEEYVDVKRTVEKEQIQGKDNIKKKEGQIHDRDSTEKKKKSSLWKLLEDTAQAKTIQEHRLSGLELLDSKQELISQYLDNGCSKSTKDESLQSIPISTDSHNVQESTQTLSEISVPSHKHESPIKKVGQRKISDFFQSTS